MLDREINEQEIRKAIFKQKNGKACGPGDIFTETLKAAYIIISSQLVKLFNRVFNDSEYPENWTLGYIILIFKGGDSNNAKHYRGITLNTTIANFKGFFLRYYLIDLQNGPKSMKKISECQFGYQKGKSTTDCIFILHSIISKLLNSGQKLYNVFIDYEKCFDRNNRVFLWKNCKNC